jgi:hypothetical protein
VEQVDHPATGLPKHRSVPKLLAELMAPKTHRERLHALEIGQRAEPSRDQDGPGTAVAPGSFLPMRLARSVPRLFDQITHINPTRKDLFALNAVPTRNVDAECHKATVALQIPRTSPGLL